MRCPKLVASVTLLALAGCGGSSTQESRVQAHPPTIANLSYSPAVVYEGSHGGVVTISVTANYLDAGGDLRHLELMVRDSNNQVIQAQYCPFTTDPGATSGTLLGQVTVPTSQAGQYTVHLGAVDCCAAVSNALTSSFRVAPLPYSAKPSMPTPRQRSVTAVAGGLIYLLGGAEASGQASLALEAYDPSTRAWASKAPMAFRRDNPVAGVIDGKVYVVGGRVSGDAERYNPATNTWSPIAPLPTPRLNAAGCVVDGKLYVLGGNQGLDLAVVEVYDPATNAWTTTAPMPFPRSWATATPVGNKIYVVGGYGGVLKPWLDAVDVFDVATATWAEGPPLPMGLKQHTALPLGGQVVVFGGDHMLTLLSVYRLNPATGQWTAGARLPRVMAELSSAALEKGFLFDGAGTYEYDSALDLGPLD